MEKSWTQIMKVADTNRKSRGHKPTKSATKFVTKSRTTSQQSHGLVADTDHESRRRDLCRGLPRFVSATLSGTCPGFCRKVGIMEFGLH